MEDLVDTEGIQLTGAEFINRRTNPSDQFGQLGLMIGGYLFLGSASLRLARHDFEATRVVHSPGALWTEARRAVVQDDLTGDGTGGYEDCYRMFGHGGERLARTVSNRSCV